MRIGPQYITPVLAAGAAALAIAAAPSAVADPGRAQPATITGAPAVGADYHGDYRGDYHDGDHRGYHGDYHGDYRGDWRGWFPRGWHW